MRGRLVAWACALALAILAGAQVAPDRFSAEVPGADREVAVARAAASPAALGGREAGDDGAKEDAPDPAEPDQAAPGGAAPTDDRTADEQVATGTAPGDGAPEATPADQASTDAGAENKGASGDGGLGQAAAAEAAFVAAINEIRTEQGVTPLRVSAELTGIARRWAGRMADVGAISHNAGFSDQVRANWRKLGENVGRGPDVANLMQAFADSPSHYANLVDPDFAEIGVGVVEREGELWTAHQFMVVFDEPAPPTTPALVGAPGR